MSKFNYVVTAQKPTAVHNALTGNFTGEKDLNLILGKCTRIEIHTVSKTGLEGTFDVTIHGRISVMQLFRPKESKQDLIFICTEKYKFCVLGFDQKTREIITKAKGDIKHKIGSPSSTGQLGLIDPLNRVIGLHLYDGLFQVLPLDNRGNLTSESYAMRIEELHIIQMCFLYGCTKPTIVVLFQDSKEKRHLKTYEVNLKDKELNTGPWSQGNVESGSSWLIPIEEPVGGVLVIGEEVLAYYNGKNFKAAKMKPTHVTAWGRVDRNRFLMGDMAGNLFMIVLKTENKSVVSVHTDALGTTSSARAISYLDNGHVFIGSVYGDSQLVKLNPERNQKGSHIETVEEYPNLGSIVDFCVMDMDRQGQGQVVTCSGAFQDGSLRVIRNGIGINEEASIELPGMQGLWSLRPKFDSPHHTFLVEAFVSETRTLVIKEEELEELTDSSGFDSSAQTVYCGNLLHDFIVQVTKKSCRLIDCDKLGLIFEWTPPSGVTVTVAHGNASQILLSTTGANLVLLHVEDRKLVEKMVTKLDYEVSSIDISPLDEKKMDSSYAVLGLWTDISLRIVSLPDLKELYREKLGGEIIPRSVLFSRFGENAYVLCGLGDGHLVTFDFDRKSAKLSNRKKLALGTQPITLSTFRAKEATHVFAGGDRPTVIYASATGKLLYSNVNLKDVNYMAPFNAEVFPDSLAFATEESLVVGQMDDIQKLHIQSIPLGEQPRRIAHQKSSQTFAVCTIKRVVDEKDGSSGEVHMVRLFDEQTYEILNTYNLDPFENASSISSVAFSGESKTDYFAVGTAYALPDEPEPTHGRILIFKVTEKKLVLISSQATKGAVYCLVPFKGKLLAGINSKVQLYGWQVTGGTKKLEPECSCQGNIIVLFLRTVGDYIVVGDLMKSISLLCYRSETSTIEEYARDYDANWMTALDALSDEVFLGAESSFNLFTVQRSTTSTSEENRARLQVVGRYHLGEFVNKFAKGSLVMNLPDSKESSDHVTPSHIFCTINGVVGVIAPLTRDQFDFFSALEEALEKVVPSVGELSHKEWRTFCNERKEEAKLNFIDGDLIETFLELSTTHAEQVSKIMGIGIETLTRRVEDIARCH